MKGKYKAAFLLPLETSKYLGEDGWEFSSGNHIPTSVIGLLKEALQLSYEKTDLGIEYYTNDTIQASLFYNEKSNEEIEHIFFQAYNNSLDKIKNAFSKESVLGSSLELFIPSEE